MFGVRDAGWPPRKPVQSFRSSTAMNRTFGLEGASARTSGPATCAARAANTANPSAGRMRRGTTRDVRYRTIIVLPLLRDIRHFRGRTGSDRLAPTLGSFDARPGRTARVPRPSPGHSSAPGALLARGEVELE